MQNQNRSPTSGDRLKGEGGKPFDFRNFALFKSGKDGNAASNSFVTNLIDETSDSTDDKQYQEQ